MRSKTFTTAFTSIFLTLFTVSSMVVVLSGYSTYTNYVNPYSYAPATPPSALIASPGANATHAVIFVLDGVRPDIFDRIDLPYIKGITTWANFTNVQCSTLLSVSMTGYAVISSGCNSTESQVISNEYNMLFKADSLWNLTQRHGGTAAVVGSDGWETMFGKWINYSITFDNAKAGQQSNVLNRTNDVSIETTLSDYRDIYVASYAGQIVERYKPTFMVVHFSDTDEAAHENGTINPDGSLSATYVKAMQNEDTYVKWILGNYSAAGILSSTLVVVASDHGHVNKGGHGGIEPEVLNTLLLMNASKGVIPGKYNDPVHQNSVAPTVAAIMGWEIPTDCSGTVLFQCLNPSTKWEAIYRINLANIRLAQANITRLKTGFGEPYLTSLVQAAQSLASAKSDYGTDNNAAITSAKSSETASRNVLGSLLSAKISEEAIGRVILAIVIIVVVVILVALLFYKLRTRVRGVVVGEKKFLPDLFILVALFFVFLVVSTAVCGWIFSGSYFPDSAGAVIGGVFVPTLLTLIPMAIIFMAILLYFNKKAPKSDARVVTWASMFLITIAMVYLAGLVWYIARNGTGLPWYAHDMGEAIGYFYFVVSAMEFSLAALVGFLGGLGVSKLLGKGRKGTRK